MAGLTVGTSMILISLVNTDSIATTLTRATYQSWGRVDLLVSANGTFFSPDIATGLAESPHLQGKVRGVQAGVELVGVAADLNRRLDNPTVRLIGFDPTAQAAFGAYALTDGRSTSGENLGSDGVLVSKSLADSLQARVGDRIQVASNGLEPVHFRVAGIATAEGPGDYGGQPAVFATLDAMYTLTGNARINVIRISALGDGQQELANSQAVARLVTNALRDVAPDVDLRVRTAKADEVNEIINLAAQNGPITLALSLIIVMAGIALVVNLALALAEERRPQLAVLRALGLSRSGLVITSIIEGGIYSFGAAAIGAVPGIATAWLLVSNAGYWVPEIHEKNATVVFVVPAQSIAVSIAAGALVTLITVLVASIRTSRLTIASAVRALPEPPTGRRSGRWRIAGIIAGGLAGLSTAAIGSAELRLLGGLALIAAVGLALRSHLPNRVRATAISVAAAIWVIGIVSRLTASEIENDPWTFIVGLECFVLALSALVAVNLRIVERFIPRMLVAQLTLRPVRLTLATGALGLVLALIAFLGNAGPVHRLVAASFRSGFLSGLVGSAEAVAPISWGVAGTTLLVGLKPGVNASSFALDVRRSTFPGGIEASTMRDLLDQGGAIFRNFASEMELMLSAGLAVGVLSLGVPALRAVVERRRSIGLLRAIGFQPRHLLTAVIGESLLTAASGVAVGAAAGLCFGYIFVAAAYPGGAFGFQGVNFAAAAALVLVTAAAVTAGPALAVARTAPAEALRLVD